MSASSWSRIRPPLPSRQPASMKKSLLFTRPLWHSNKCWCFHLGQGVLSKKAGERASPLSHRFPSAHPCDGKSLGGAGRGVTLRRWLGLEELHQMILGLSQQGPWSCSRCGDKEDGDGTERTQLRTPKASGGSNLSQHQLTSEAAVQSQVLYPACPLPVPCQTDDSRSKASLMLAAPWLCNGSVT